MNANTLDNPGVIAPPPLIYMGGLAIGLLLHRLIPLKNLPHSARGMELALGSSCIGAGLLVGLAGFRQMRLANTNINPTQPTNAIVSDGPFRFTRNPLYLGMASLYLGITFLANSVWPMLILPVVLGLMNFGVIEREERYLERKFGAQYVAYKQRVRRWL
jgi:protein-S-isoprenylcysteine O-methyltransferase Ste14